NKRGGLQDFFLVQRRVGGACGHIGYAGDSEDANSAVARGNDLWNRGHADQIRADCAKRINFRRSLVAWTLHGEIDAIVDVQGQVLAFLGYEALELAIV